jgi:hypothetical protein
MTGERVQLVGCSALRKEVVWLAEKNHWPLDTQFMDSALHIDFDKLADRLTSVLSRHADQHPIVLYGACHPNMEQLLQDAGALRVQGQNCVEMLLGQTAFTAELAQGAFFLLEDWARRWEEILTKTFGTNLSVIRDIFQGDRKCLLCLKTLCSGDFVAQAEGAGCMVGLPVRWQDVALDHFESVLAAALKRRWEENACPT